MSEEEYLECLKRIRADYISKPDALYLAFLLLLAFRFGLRSDEAVNLRRCDWCQYQGLHWVLVRNNYLRELKTAASRRAVPLIDTLSPDEQNLVDEVIANHRAVAGKGTNRPLMCELVDGKVVLAPSITRLIEQASLLLKRVTGRFGFTLHQLRHAFYNRIAPALLGINTPLTNDLVPGSGVVAVRSLVLGMEHEVSRRSGMAMARLLGHQHPRTGLRNYCHSVTDWADSLTPVSHARARKIEGALDIEALETVAREPVMTSEAEAELPSLTLESVLKALRLMSFGVPSANASAQMRLTPEHGEILDMVFRKATSGMRFRDAENGWTPGCADQYRLIRSINQVAWKRLLERAREFDDSNGLSCATKVPAIDDLPYLVGLSGSLFAWQPEHCGLINATLRAFGTPTDSLLVVAKNDDAEIASMVSEHGLNLTPMADAGLSNGGIDVCWWRFKGTLFRTEQYATILLKTGADGPLRDRHQLVLAALSFAVFKNFQAASGSDIH